MNIYAKFIPKYTKKENEFIQKIVNNLLNHKPLVFDLNKIELIKRKDDINAVFMKLIKKSLLYSMENEKGVLQPFEGYILNEKNVELKLSVVFKDALMEKNSYKSLLLKETIFFTSELTKEFFYKFILGKNNSTFYISLEEFRTVFEIKEYERFYDFERNILKSIIKDINSNTNYKLAYDKIKHNEFKNSKVIGISFTINNKNEEFKAEKVNKLISHYSDKIKDYRKVFDMLFANVDLYSETELEILLYKAGKEYKKRKTTFENHLESYLLKENQFLLLNEFSGEFLTPIKLENQLSNILSKLDVANFLENQIDSTKFLMKLYAAKKNKEFYFEKNDLLISINYNPSNISSVKIFQVNY